MIGDQGGRQGVLDAAPPHDFVTEWCIEELPHDHGLQHCQCGSRPEGTSNLEDQPIDGVSRSSDPNVTDRQAVQNVSRESPALER